MSFLYYIKETFVYITYYILSLTIAILYMLFNKLYIINKIEKYITNNYDLININMDHIVMSKLEWKYNLKNKNIFYIEYYTMETIFYKMMLINIVIITITYIICIITKWLINISYVQEKKSIFVISTIIILFLFLDINYKQYNINNIYDNINHLKKNMYYNDYYEPLFTIESIVDTNIYNLIFVIIKYTIIVYFIITKINILNRLIINTVIFILINIDPLFIFYNIIDIEAIILISKITFIKYGDDRN